MSVQVRERGFTLIEMMVVLVIIAIIFSIGIPSFDDLIKRNSVESLQMKLASAVSSARAEAAARNSVISLCPSNDAVSCSGSWNDGWISFEDHDVDGALDSTEIVVDVYEHDSNYTFTATNSGGSAVTLISFSTQGYMQGTESTLFSICEPDSAVRYARGLFVNASGLMIKTSDGADGDTTHDSPFDAAATDPDDLTCS